MSDETMSKDPLIPGDASGGNTGMSNEEIDAILSGEWSFTPTQPESPVAEVADEPAPTYVPEEDTAQPDAAESVWDEPDEMSEEATAEVNTELPELGFDDAEIAQIFGDDVPENGQTDEPAMYDSDAVPASDGTDVDNFPDFSVPDAEYSAEPMADPWQTEDEPQFPENAEQIPEEEPKPQKPRRLHWWQKRKKRRTPILVRLVIYASCVVLVGVTIGMFAWECAQDVLALGHADSSAYVVIEKSDVADKEHLIDTVTDMLYAKGLIKHKWLFKLYCSFSHAEEKIDPGVYTLNTLYDYHALVYGMIADSGTRATATIMIPEGYDCEQIYQLLEENNICTAEELRQVAQNNEFDYWFLEKLPPQTDNRLEGYLYPDTYEFYISDDPEEVLDKMLRNFDRKIDEDMQKLIRSSGFSLHDILKIASIIEEEAASDADRSDVSAVIHNRLNSYDYRRLEMDSTVNYACRGLGYFDKEVDSPYNTYKYTGLPAGPIDNPGMSSILAALEPSETDYMFFATGKDGENHFFDNYEDHLEFINSDEF